VGAWVRVVGLLDMMMNDEDYTILIEE
jgi:hypothetical protein